MIWEQGVLQLWSMDGKYVYKVKLKPLDNTPIDPGSLYSPRIPLKSDSLSIQCME